MKKLTMNEQVQQDAEREIAAQLLRENPPAEPNISEEAINAKRAAGLDRDQAIAVLRDELNTADFPAPLPEEDGETPIEAIEEEVNATAMGHGDLPDKMAAGIARHKITEKEIREKMAPGLTKKQAVEVLLAQRVHDEWLARSATKARRSKMAAIAQVRGGAEKASGAGVLSKSIALRLSRTLTEDEKKHLEEWKVVLQKRHKNASAVRKRLGSHRELMDKICGQRDALQVKASTGLDSKAIQDHEAVLMQIRLLGNTINLTENDGVGFARDLQRSLSEAQNVICTIIGPDLTQQLYEAVADAVAPFFLNRGNARAICAETDAIRALGQFLNPNFMTMDVEFLSFMVEQFSKTIDAMIEGGVLFQYDTAPEHAKQAAAAAA